jgi:hypothetical protein
MKVPDAKKAGEDANLIRKQLGFDGNQGQGDLG